MVGSDKVKNMFKKKFPSLSSLGSDGNTSFLRAARAGHLDKVLEQLRNNVDINTSNANGLNALHLASKDGHVHVVTELLKRGANVDSATKKGNTALHIASLAGQEEVVRLLVEHGASVNVQSQNGFTPLYMAAQENHDNVVKYLLANGANQSLATEDGFTPLAVAMQQGHDKVVAVLLENDTRGKVRLPALHIAAKKDDCKAAALLLQNEHNPDVTSKSGFTPLHIASHYGNEGIANLLLSKGADVNYSAKHNITPLHVAAKWGKSNMVSLLLEKGANIESKTRDGLTPLHCAARSGHEQVVDMLLERGAPISSKTKNGLAPLHMSSQGDHVDAARILLYHRAPVDEVTVDYLTALHVAAHCGHARVAKLLLDRKADPNARALNGFTPLHIACKKNRIKVVELLLKHGASIEATTESGLTPLHVASFMGCMNIVIYLLQNEANPDVPTVRGETPLHLAARANQTDIIRILLRNGAQVDARAREQQTPLHIASRLGNVDIVMLLLQHGAAVDCTTKDLYSALHIAAKEGQDEVASVLLENGASPTATTKKGFTPLHLAAKYGNMKVARLLLQRDAPVDAQGKNGVTPLHVASHYDHQNVALLLLDKGASPHATAKNGHTPLHIAAKKNQMDIATTLLEYGAKANAESKAGFTPLHLSAQEGHVDMSSLLIDHHADTNQRAKNGLTPLHLCAQEDRVNVASVLVKNSAEVDATTKAGYTALHVACHFGQLNMVKFLLEEGSKVGTSTAVGYTPLHQAAQQGHCAIINTLLEHGAPPNATTNQGQTAMSIAQKLGYISVVETLKGVTEPIITPTGLDEKYKVVSPETMQETFMSDSEDEGGEDTLLSEQPYRYLTVDEMKSLGDDSLPIDVRQDERLDSNRECMTVPPTAVDDTISPQHLKEAYSQFTTPDNIDISKHPLHVGFLVSFLVDARGGAMRGCRHSGVRVIVPPRRASMPMRVTCRYLKRDKLSHPPPLMEGEALASRILELGPVGAKFLGPVMIEVPHFGSLRGKEREIVILRSDNGETWREHTMDCSEEAVQDVLSHSFDKEDIALMDDNARTTRILTTDFPHYFAVVTRVRQEVHAIGPEGGMVSSSVVPQVQAVFPQGALTKKIKVGLQAQPISAELAAKLLGNRVAVSPIVTVEPRRRKFHKPITLTIPKPQAANKGMINQYSGDAPTLRLLCSITGGTTRAQWEDVTGSTPFTFVNDCVSFTTTVSARFWLMDCRNVGDATKMATELYRDAIHVPFMAKFVVFAKRVDPLEARLRIFCMTDDKEDKTLEHQEHFTEVAKSRDVEVLEGKTQYVEFAGNLVPVTKSGEQLQLGFRAFRENRLPFTVRVKDPHADCIGRTLFMREARLPKGEPPQQPICVLNIVLPEEIIPETIFPEHELHKYSFTQDSSGLESYQRVDLRLSDISNLLGGDWVSLAEELGISTSDINRLKTEHPQSVAQQGLAMLRLWLSQAGNKAQASTLESALNRLGRDDIVQQCVFNVDQSGLQLLKDESRDASIRRSIPYSDKDIMKDSESVEDISRTSLRKTGDTVEKDDKEERKYEAEEKEVEEVKKSVLERRKEIEKRLSLDKSFPKIDGMVIEKNIVQTGEELSEKEIAEEKRVSSPDEEPSELSFAQKRLSFEQGKKIIEMKPDKTTMKEVKERADERFLAEERKAAEVLEEKKSMVDETSIPFQEKRKSFEQGLKDEKEKEKKEETRKEDLRRDSALFEGVSQGLVRLDAAFTAAPQVQDLLSPKVSKTPPPSPAEFKDLTGTVAWTEEPTNVVPMKIDQSQDWAEKRKSDSTLDSSKKGTSELTMKKEVQVESEENKSHISVTSKTTESKNIVDKEIDTINEKDSKYQFTMSVPNKQSFTETLVSITTFLDAEKTYNKALADFETLSSDESQSKSENEPKSDKSFMGKVSKKLFGAFKKDDKEKNEKKKDKKKKHKNEKSSKEVISGESEVVSSTRKTNTIDGQSEIMGEITDNTNLERCLIDTITKEVSSVEDSKDKAYDCEKRLLDSSDITLPEKGDGSYEVNEDVGKTKTQMFDIGTYSSMDKVIPILEEAFHKTGESIEFGKSKTSEMKTAEKSHKDINEPISVGDQCNVYKKDVTVEIEETFVTCDLKDASKNENKEGRETTHLLKPDNDLKDASKNENSEGRETTPLLKPDNIMEGKQSTVAETEKTLRILQLTTQVDDNIRKDDNAKINNSDTSEESDKSIGFSQLDKHRTSSLTEKIIDKSDSEDEKFLTLDVAKQDSRTVRETMEKSKNLFSAFFYKSGGSQDKVKSKATDTTITTKNYDNAKDDPMAEAVISKTPEFTNEENPVKIINIDNETRKELKNETISTVTEYSTKQLSKTGEGKYVGEPQQVVIESAKEVKDQAKSLVENVVKVSGDIVEEHKSKIVNTTESFSAKSKDAKEKTKSFFGSIFSKTGVDDIEKNVNNTSIISTYDLEKKNETLTLNQGLVKNVDLCDKGNNNTLPSSSETVIDNINSITIKAVKTIEKDINVDVELVKPIINENEEVKSVRVQPREIAIGKTILNESNKFSEINESITLPTEAVKEPKEKSKSFLGGIFSKVDELSNRNRNRMADTKTTEMIKEGKSKPAIIVSLPTDDNNVTNSTSTMNKTGEFVPSDKNEIINTVPNYVDDNSFFSMSDKTDPKIDVNNSSTVKSFNVKENINKITSHSEYPSNEGVHLISDKLYEKSMSGVGNSPDMTEEMSIPDLATSTRDNKILSSINTSSETNNLKFVTLPLAPATELRKTIQMAGDIDNNIEKNIEGKLNIHCVDKPFVTANEITGNVSNSKDSNRYVSTESAVTVEGTAADPKCQTLYCTPTISGSAIEKKTIGPRTSESIIEQIYDIGNINIEEKGIKSTEIILKTTDSLIDTTSTMLNEIDNTLHITGKEIHKTGSINNVDVVSVDMVSKSVGDNNIHKTTENRTDIGNRLSDSRINSSKGTKESDTSRENIISDQLENSIDDVMKLLHSDKDKTAPVSEMILKTYHEKMEPSEDNRSSVTSPKNEMSGVQSEENSVDKHSNQEVKLSIEGFELPGREHFTKVSESEKISGERNDMPFKACGFNDTIDQHDDSSGGVVFLQNDFNDIIPEDLKENIVTREISENVRSNDDKLNNILIDMLIEQECIKPLPHDISASFPIKSDETSVSESLPEKHDTEFSEKTSKDSRLFGFKTTASFGEIESVVIKTDLKSSSENYTTPGHSSYVTTPTMQRRKIGGSQRLSREERPALRDVSHLIEYSSSEEDEINHYIVTEPSDQSFQRKVAFHIESEDEDYLKVTDSSSELDIEVTEMTPSPDPTSKKQTKTLVEDSAMYPNEENVSIIKCDKKVQKLEQRFQRMASETLEIDPESKNSADREFQRMVSQLSTEEVDACLNQWEEGGLTPSEEHDSTNDTMEGDLDPDVEDLPEASLVSGNPFYSSSLQWVDLDHDIRDIPSIFWAFDTAPTSAVIQPNELDIPVRSILVKGESSAEENKKSPVTPSTREGEEELLDLATGLQDSKGSSTRTGSGTSSTK